MKRSLCGLGATIAVALAMLLLVSGSALADSGSFHYVGPNGSSTCMNVEFPQSDWFGPGIGVPNATSIANASRIVDLGGVFWIARIANGQSDVYDATTYYILRPPEVGQLSTDAINPYVSVDKYTLYTGSCPLVTESYCVAATVNGHGMWSFLQVSQDSFQPGGDWQVKNSQHATVDLGGQQATLQGADPVLAPLVPGVGWTCDQPYLHADGTYDNPSYGLRGADWIEAFGQTAYDKLWSG